MHSRQPGNNVDRPEPGTRQSNVAPFACVHRIELENHLIYLVAGTAYFPCLPATSVANTILFTTNPNPVCCAVQSPSSSTLCRAKNRRLGALNGDLIEPPMPLLRPSRNRVHFPPRKPPRTTGDHSQPKTLRTAKPAICRDRISNLAGVRGPWRRMVIFEAGVLDNLFFRINSNMIC